MSSLLIMTGHNGRLMHADVEIPESAELNLNKANATSSTAHFVSLAIFFWWILCCVRIGCGFG